MRRAILVALVLCYCRAKVPTNYVLDVTPTCGKDSIEDATIDILTDLDASASAVCENDTTVNFVDLDGVNFKLNVSYPNRGSNPCVFHQREGTYVYVMKVLVSFAEPGKYLHQEEEEFTVSCVFDQFVKNKSSYSVIQSSLIAPSVIQNAQGRASNSTFILQLIDVAGKDISGTEVWRSRKVQLKASTDGAGGEVGLRPVGCDAVSNTGSRYAVIRAGCGDGIVFKKDVGFITDGLVTKSPYFEAFGIEGDIELSFECNFTTCIEECNGSSCELNPKRRSISLGSASNFDQVLLRSRPIHLKESTLNRHVTHMRPKQTHSDDVDNSAKQLETTSALYWTVILGLGLIVLTSLAVSLTACSGVNQVRVREWNKA